MPLREHEVGAFDLAFSLAEAVSLLHPTVATRHIQVANISAHIASLLDLPPEREYQLILAGLLHFVGLCGLGDIQEEVDAALQYNRRNALLHPEAGYLLLSLFPPFAEVARIVRFHHAHWEEGRGEEHLGEEVPLESQILHLAEGVSWQMAGEEFILRKKDEIKRSIEGQKGKIFIPLLVDAFLELSDKEYFWLDCAQPRLSLYLTLKMKEYPLRLGREDTISLARMIAHIIDFRSPRIATHSLIVGDIARELAKSLGFSPLECEEMRIAGYLHDIGKLATPLEILEKPDKLTQEEFQIVRAHPPLLHLPRAGARRPPGEDKTLGFPPPREAGWERIPLPLQGRGPVPWRPHDGGGGCPLRPPGAPPLPRGTTFQ